jgi:hypothetical protein
MGSNRVASVFANERWVDSLVVDVYTVGSTIIEGESSS